jgi:hypothetical protein
MTNVVILPQYEFVFFCMPKVANSSIKVAILNALGFEPTKERRHNHPALNISKPQVVYNCCMNFFKATIVRNPFDRLVSCYESKIKDPYKCKKQGFMAAGFNPEMTFNEYIDRVCVDPFANIHFQPQMPALKCCNTLLVDFIGFFERLTESWEFIRATAKLKMGKLKHLNKTAKRKPYRKYYDGRTKRMVSEVFEEDLNFFGYQY